MAMTISGLSESQLDDTLVGAIQAVAPRLDLFSHAFSDEGLIQGNSYVVPVIGALTSGSKTAGTLGTANASLTGCTVTASTFKYASWEITEGKVSSKIAAKYMAEQAVQGVKKLGCDVIDVALGLLTEANFGTGTNNQVVDSDFDEDTVVALRTAAQNKIKDMDKSCILNPAKFAAYRNLNSIVLAIAGADSAKAVSGYLPGGSLGYDVFEYVNMPANSENLVGAVVGKGAIAIVAGAPDQLIGSGQGDVAYRRIITDPESGLSVQYTEAVSGGGKISGEVAVICGAAKAIDAAVLLATA